MPIFIYWTRCEGSIILNENFVIALSQCFTGPFPGH